MPTPTWTRRNITEIQDAFQPIPSLSASSRKDFRPPPTIQSDFKRQLDHEVPYVNFTFELVHDWFQLQDPEYQHTYIRGQQTPIEWKSKVGNSDMSTNFKVTHEVPIYKGDMLIREDGMIYLLNWNVQNNPNNQASQSIECNAALTIKRDVPETVDKDGYLIEPAGEKIIVDSLPCIHSEYAGRPDYVASQGSAGIAPDHLITVSLQWNPSTANIHVNDRFELGNFTYRVVNISIAEVNITKEHGVLIFNAKRVAGGGLYD